MIQMIIQETNTHCGENIMDEPKWDDLMKKNKYSDLFEI